MIIINDDYCDNSNNDIEIYFENNKDVNIHSYRLQHNKL